MSEGPHYPIPDEWAEHDSHNLLQAPKTPLIAENGHFNGVKRSASIGKLVEALCQAQAEFAPVVKANINPQFKSKYADLATIINATMPALAKHGLAIIQTPYVKGRELTMTTMLVHSSDEWISNELTMPATMRNELTAQTIGSACTYSRRYALQSILGVAADVDDDGTDASGGGSREAVKAVVDSKLDGFSPSLFYVWHDESQTAEITGAESLKTANRDILKPLWNGAAGAVVANAEQLEALKYELEKRNVLFRPLGTASLEDQLKASIKKVKKREPGE